jgi:2-(1,2-epoxy-1,2-dihydrophenyl)acetyl-CoA isomerase
MNILKEETKDGVYTITLNRPERKNALNNELLSALQGALENAGREGSAVVVIRGSGGAFCAGGDIGEFRELVREGKSLDGGASILHKCVMLIRKLNAVTIAVLEGVVVGGGIGISLACDLSVAVQGTVMNLAYRKIGLTPDGGASILLPGTIGAKKSNELYFLARNVGMEEAKELGLVNFVWEKEDLEARLVRLVSDLTAFPPETVGSFKDLTNDAVFAGLEAHLDKERSYLSELGGKPGFKDRLERFFAKKSGGSQ